MSAEPETLWRIAKHTLKYQASDMSGDGAKRTGGRWHSKGVAAVYAATSIALATLETLAHLGNQISPRNAFLVKLTVPVSVWRTREIIEVADLPATWLAEPPGLTTVELGDGWLAGLSSSLLLVPSVIIPEEYNVLINPCHPDSSRIKAVVLRQYIYDPRM